MVIPFTDRVIISALGLSDLRTALRILTSPPTPEGGGLGFSRRQVARSLGVNESTLRGIEREGSRPRQETVDTLNRRIVDLDLMVNRENKSRTRQDTLVSPDVPSGYYKPLAPNDARAFRIVVKTPPDTAYPFATLTPRTVGTFNVDDEIVRLRDEGFEVARVIWDRGN